MTGSARAAQAAVPSVDRVIRLAALRPLIEVHGRAVVTTAARAALAELRQALADEGEAALDEAGDDAVVARIADHVAAMVAPTLAPVFNLTGTVLHTNLGRAPLPIEAIEAVAAVAKGASNLEFDLKTGRRGDRDDHLESWLCRLTGAEAATVVNNNAAAVLLTLNSLALRKEVPLSRGELIEIGGAFRMPDIMKRAGCKLIEVGTTNRTHLADYAGAICARTALVMKVHTSNYAVEGFTAAVEVPELARLADEKGLALVVDLGSGMLVPLERYGLPHEPTAGEILAQGADIVTFSGDKLLGGPQAGIIAGRADLIARIRRNPMKRAMRVDKMTIAALAAVLRLYADPERLAERLPALRLLARPVEDIEAVASRLRPVLAGPLAEIAAVEIVSCQSQIGSGALPVDRLPSVALSIRPAAAKRGAGAVLRRLTQAFRALPVPVIGRVQDGALILDLRCLEDEATFVDQIGLLAPGEAGKA
ncbi:MAG: L-seryl-tRNA(Sec) selenium transferase [Proteobacteria bacterium]|nr:L-seryl-tRNA(Sec) selenium transferase [Pseudomonadota bacterium]